MNDTQIRKLLTDELRAKVAARVRECLDLASVAFPEKAARFAEMPHITYDIKNRFGGLAYSGGPDDWTIRLNLILCYENEPDFILNTVGHEVAHLIARAVYGFTKKVQTPDGEQIKKVRSHGPEWKHVMENVLGLEPAVKHKYDTSSIETKERGRKRAPAGSLIGGSPNPTLDELKMLMDMRRRLETGFKRLGRQHKLEFIAWANEHVG